ncbi:hypothetical protein N7492_006000 [Penicillium capsulatum]|uniref:Uncharacterized protein n=1 Tax=Penicillium capsulatum TaxID=69766 RepID=A0A9W9IEE2_9EURO|nr:hypothetical protein N7492_006000 [Penicillium capsulatum]
MPFAWYWLGKSLHKGYARGERIKPIYINRDGDLIMSRRSSRASFSVEKARRQGEMRPDQSRASSPSRSERVSPSKKFCGVCSPVESESDEATQAKLPCACCHKAPSPLRPHNPTPAPTPLRTATSVHGYCCVCQVGGVKTALPVFRDHSHGYQTPTPAPTPQASQGETVRGKSPQGKCACCQHAVPAEPETRRHAGFYSEECHGECVFVDMSPVDDALSETSIEVNSESDRGDECDCGHLIISIPCGVLH